MTAQVVGRFIAPTLVVAAGSTFGFVCSGDGGAGNSPHSIRKEADKRKVGFG